MRINWKYGKIYSMKLRDNLYTLCQLLSSPMVLIYDIKNKDGKWPKNCLNGINPLFRVYAGIVVGNLLEKRVDVDFSQDSINDFEDFNWIKPHLFNEHPDNDGTRYDYRLHPLFLGGRLIKSAPSEDDMGPNAIILNNNLKLPVDRDTIERVEMTNMWGADDLKDRLIRYFDTGINRDDLKFFCFPGLWDDIEKLRPLTRRVPHVPGWGLSAARSEADFSFPTQLFFK